MRATQTCPKRAGKKFAVSTELKLRDENSSSGTYALPAITIQLPSRRAPLGKLETWICTRCGYTEFYAYGIGEINTLARYGIGDLNALARQYPDQLRVVDAEPQGQGPYR